MLTKIIDLGHEVPETGEPRVRLLESSLIKTASTEIQSFWDSIEPDSTSSYLWVIGVSAKEFYGCNNNGDAFTEEDLKKTHNDFVNNAHVFLQHVNKDPRKSIGKPVYSWYNDAMHRVELVLKIDKNNPDAQPTVLKIERGDPIYVSMGCSVAYDQCSICGNQAPTRKDYCDHLRYNMKKILPDGRQVYALNPNPKFFDISIVAKPADPTAFTLDKRASMEKTAYTNSTFTDSATLGEISNDLAIKVASLRKLSDLVKEVEGTVVDRKSTPQTPIQQIAAQGFENMDYPEMPYDKLHSMGVSPAGLLSCLTDLGAPMTFGDAAWMSGLHAFDHNPSHDEYHDMFSNLPKVLPFLEDHPEFMDGIMKNVLSSYNGEFSTPVNKTIVIRVMKPVAEMRISIIRQIAPKGMLVKLGTALGQPDDDMEQFGHTTAQQYKNYFLRRKENFAPITLRDQYGHEAQTSPYYLRQGLLHGDTSSKLFSKPSVAAALALGTLGAVLVTPGLLRKALAVSAMGIPAAALVSAINKDNATTGGITTSEGDVISDNLAAASFKVQKTAALQAPRFGTMAGMAIPGAAALDYTFNQWKYGPYYNPEEGGVLNTVGKFVADHPVVSAVTGGLIGSQVGRIGNLLRKVAPAAGKAATKA